MKHSISRSRKFKALLVVAILLIAAPNVFASNGSIVTEDLTGTLTAADLVLTLLGEDSGATVSNITFTGDERAAGVFSGGTGLVGFESGVVLSSGRINDVVGPNDSDSTTTALGQPGDPDLQSLIPGYTTFDATLLEFDFDCEGIPIFSFEYTFTSEEYNEYTNSPFNNVFGFFLDHVNIALIPGTTTPVSINNVNGGHPSECYNGFDDDGDTLIDGADPDCTTPLDNVVGENNSNSAFYINNDCSDPDGGAACPLNIEADGLTISLPAQSSLTPGSHHIKLGISDAGDSILDSWVFIKEGSFQCAPPGGFVTGGGWFDSLDGSYKPDPSLAGKANFGFVSKYKKGATVPTGQTQFQFQVASLNFHSSSYDLLVVTHGGTFAQFKGSGTINGEGDYKFMIWAGDGAPDTFRIKIWEEVDSGEIVIYDNGFDQELGGGSIVVHK
jgi:hypothetical protein